jgi:hypothetical protein
MPMQRLALALALSLAAATPAVAGPPWLTLEFRPNTFAGVVMVRTFHHGTAQAMTLAGTAEGLVSGQRRSMPLTFERVEEPNVYGVANTWGAEGVWVLNVSVTDDHIGAGAVVGLDRNGEPAFARFPRTAIGASRAATPREVEAMLRALEANAPPAALGRTGWSAIVFRTAMPVLVLVALVLGVAKLGAGIFARARHRHADAVAA